ncbi:methylmalonyl-CoA mutase family protein [Shivajiella indica]|uniref:Methylmalonyl-CoA mutase family protein n=1 Tax=Shivajiella indica TaxID=872115 RepID=A0ABW5B9S1_9BACT
MEFNLFEDFPTVSKKDWIQLATKDLKGKDFEQTLVSETLDGIKIFPFYTKEDLNFTAGLLPYQHQINPNPGIPGISRRYWSNIISANGKEEKLINKELIMALQQGADAIYLQMEGNENLDLLLKDIVLPYIKIYIGPKSNKPYEIIRKFIEWVKIQNIATEELHGGIIWDGIGACLIEKNDLLNIAVEVKGLMDLLSPFPNFCAISIGSSQYHDAGATMVQELAYSLAGYIELLERLYDMGIEWESIFKKTLLHASAGSQFFEELCKLRAFKILFHQLAQLYNVKLDPEKIPLFTETSRWTKSRWDIHTNMLRNTSEAMSALLGGSHALWVRPHIEPLGIGNDFSKRMALNISNILKEESYLDKVLDPVAGSFFLENLTLSIFEKVKSELEQIELQGGWWKLYVSNIIQEKVKDSRLIRQNKVLRGETTKIGVNKFPGDTEEIRSPEKVIEESWQLLPSWETFLFEKENSKKS